MRDNGSRCVYNFHFSVVVLLNMSHKFSLKQHFVGEQLRVFSAQWQQQGVENKNRMKFKKNKSQVDTSSSYWPAGGAL